MNVDKDGSRPMLYVSLKERIVESPNSSAAPNSSGAASTIIDEDPCEPPMDNDIDEDPCKPPMDNDCPDNVHGDDLENPASRSHSYVDGTCFKSGDTFKDKRTLVEALGIAALKAHFNFYVWKNKSVKYMARCIDDSCKWILHANKYIVRYRFIITVYCNEHTCGIQQVFTNHSKASCVVIARHIVGKFEEGAGITPKKIQKKVSERISCEISYWKAYQAGIIAKEFIRGSAADGYSKLIPYSWIVHSTNPESKTNLQLNKEGRFLYYFLAFEAWIRRFKHMLKIIAVDGTHLKEKHGGVC
ncbi:uncharacterized protein LOC132038510 [Lycium ferocissimum]|uniref:uncharacterized protein LOC132038510 n=1 Tax=Lycium ferocissimum TaxID=112874 RepID=UPI002816540B|nr:uncharacterized protein LOC132038510 [Lycium ferocissimum]